MQKLQKRYCSGLLAFALFSGGVFAYAGSNLVQDMVRFDQAYIPTLAMTSDEKLELSRVTISSLSVEWNAFKKEHYGERPADEEWKSDFDKVDGRIEAAKNIIARGTGLKDAHEELEHIRLIFMHLRNRNGIDYYIDYLTRFHEPMEKIVLAAKGKTESSLTDEDLKIIQETLPLAKEMWRATSTAKFDAALYGFDRPKTNMLYSLVKKEEAALRRLERALKSKNRKVIIDAALAVKPDFAKIFKSFGRFPKK